MIFHNRTWWELGARAQHYSTRGPKAEPHVIVRVLILSLARFEIASKDETRAIEKAWAAYRKQHRLDIEGRALAGAPKSCPH